MSAATTVSALLKSTTQGPAWHGPALSDLLDGLSVEDAMLHPIDGAHSIWEIVNHLNLWQSYTLAVLQGEDVSFLDRQDDWPKPSGKDADWQRACRMLEGVGREIREIVIHFDDARLKTTVPDSDYTLKILLHGVVSHNVYHAGQIALLKKCLEQSQTATQMHAVAK